MALIVFEGIDGSGKSTQFDLLTKKPKGDNCAPFCVRFPQYGERSAAPLEMYLSGDFGDDPSAVSPYAASMFYATDRFASFQRVWKNAYIQGRLIFADRYTTSNAVHQGAKLERDARVDFFRWLDDLEHEKLALPRPDIVLYMDISLEVAFANIQKRVKETGCAMDIHETDTNYLARCLDAANHAADFFGWAKIKVCDREKMRPIADIHQDIIRTVSPIHPIADHL